MKIYDPSRPEEAAPRKIVRVVFLMIFWPTFFLCLIFIAGGKIAEKFIDNLEEIEMSNRW